MCAIWQKFPPPPLSPTALKKAHLVPPFCSPLTQLRHELEQVRAQLASARSAAAAPADDGSAALRAELQQLSEQLQQAQADLTAAEARVEVCCLACVLLALFLSV
jgi:septal ring factor EnvC (AmiA/AmiB activator)